MKRALSALIVLSCSGALAFGEATTRPASYTQAGEPPATRPNVVFVIADQLRYQSCGFAGDCRAKTPNMDTLAQQGVVFRNAISGHPVCSAYRASLLTGNYTTSTGMIINELRMNPNHECLAHVLTRNGYETAYVGKWHLWANELGNHGDPKNSFTPPGPYRLGLTGFGPPTTFITSTTRATTTRTARRRSWPRATRALDLFEKRSRFERRSAGS